MNSHNADENFVKFDWQKLCGRIRLPNCFGQSPDSPTRVHQVWPGNNVFFFNGRVICGPDPRGFLLTITSILLSEWIFCTYIDDFPPQNSIIITLSEFFTLTAIGSLVLACTRDPGIIPRNANLPLIEEVGSSSSTSTSMRRTRSRRITVDGIEIKLKYCSICKIFRPPRSCHCSVCDNCVEKFDHHCPWIGQCIGLRNYRYYMIFLLSALTFFGYMFGFSCWRMRKRVSGRHGGVFQSLMNIPETICLLVFSCFAVCFIGGLAMYHLYLIVLNQTGNENFKRQYAKSSNPYDKGALSNIKEALFSNLPPSKVNFRSVVEPRSDSNWADGGGAVQDEEAFISKAESP